MILIYLQSTNLVFSVVHEVVNAQITYILKLAVKSLEVCYVHDCLINFSKIMINIFSMHLFNANIC